LDEILLGVIIFSVALIIVIEFIIYKEFEKRFQSIDKFSDSASKLDGTVSTMQTLSSNLFNQVNAVKDLQADLKLKFQNFYDMLIMKPSVKGRVGEGIVKFILSSFPEDLWEDQCEINGCGIVDFAIFMPPDRKILPMDAKFSLPEDIFPETELREGEFIFLDKDKRKKANTLAIKRMKEVIKYINPSVGTMNFALMFIPDSVYLAITNETLKELRSNRVIPVNTSGLISTLFLIERQYVSIKISEVVDHLEDIKYTVEGQFSKITEDLRKAETQSRNSYKNIGSAINSLIQAEDNILRSFGLLEE